MTDRQIFLNAPADATEEVLNSYLNKMCGEDESLRSRVEALMAADEEAGSFLQEAPLEGHRKALAEDEVPTLEEDVPLAEKAGDTIGNYKLLQKIGEGGFGVVYMADQLKPVKRRVAFKLIKLGMDTKQVVARFEAERQALAMMDHPNIAKVLDAGATETGRPFFVMELVKGIPITKFCDEQNLSTKERLSLYIDVCRAVQHAHQKGIIHRDLKPSNVMVTMHDDKAVPKVIDFGVAKATQQDLTDKTLYTRYEQFIGTPAYMSPEQAQLSGLDIDTRSDIYSLGVLLYELLTGRTPFDPKQLAKAGYDEIRRVIREEEPSKPSTRLSTLGDAELTDLAKTRKSGPNRLRALLRGDLDWIVMKALEKDRTRRYETSNALAMDIRRHLDDEPVTAVAPSASYRISKYVRRHRGPVLTAGTIVALLITGVATTTWQWIEARQSEKSERKRAEEALASEEKAEKARVEADASAAAARANAKSLRLRAYTADMGLAAAAIEQGNLGRARMLLDRYRPQDAQVDVRGFEWRYLWARSRGDETATLGEYKGWLGGIAASPDGTMLACAGPTTLVRERPSGRILAELGDVNGSLTFSPDGRVLFNAGSGEIRRWDTGTWNELPRIKGANHPCAFAQRRPIMVARDGDGLAVWSTEDGSKQQTLSDSVRWNNPYWNFQTLVISADDALVFAASRGLAIRSWNLDDGSERPPIELEDRHLVVSVAVSSRNVLAVGNFSGSVTLWDAATGTKLQSLSDHDAWVSRAVFSPDGTMLASASADQKILLYDMNSDGTASFRRRFVGHEAEIWALSFSADGAWLYSGSGHDGTLRLWSTAPAADDAEILEDVLVQHASPQLGLYGLHDQDKPVHIDFTTGRPKIVDLSFPTEFDASEFLHLPWRSLASRETEEGIEFRSTRSGQREKFLPGPFRRLELSDDGSLLATLGSHGLQVWDMSNWNEILTDPRFTKKDTEKLYFSPDNSKIALTPPQYGTGEAVVLSLATGEEVMRFPVEQIMASGFSPDGNIFAAGTGRNVIILWDLSAKEQIAVIRGHVSGIKGLAFSPDGRTIASCGGNQVRLWNVATRQEILTLHRGDATASKAWFSSDGSTLATTAVGRRVRFWRAPGFDEIAEFEASDTGLDEIRRRTLRGRLALGPDRRKSAEEYRKLADSLVALGEFDTLRAQFEKELTRQKALDEPDLTALDVLVASVLAGGRGEEALEMQRSLVDLAEPDSPRARDALRKVARCAVAIGNWEEGKKALKQAIAIPSEEEGLSMDEMKLAALFLWSGDLRAYESHTEAWVARYQEAEGPLSPDRVAKCYFAAEREGDEALESLAAELAERTSAPGAPDWFAPWGALCRGIVEYRTGKHKEALKSLITAQNGNEPCKAAAHAYSAMAAYRLNDAEAARKHLEQARTENDPVLEPGEGDLGSSWHDRVFALLALKEAETLINGEEGAQP